MRYGNDHLDYMPLTCPTFGWQRTPPCNYELLAAAAVYAGYAALAASAVSGYIQYDSAQTQKEQSKLNAEAQNEAIGAEQNRLAAEESENRRRAVMQQRRMRASQTAALASTGAMIGTGSALDFEVDTWQKQQTELADQERIFQLSQRQLAYEGQSVLQQGEQQAAAFGRQATGAAIQGLANTAGSAYSAWSTRPQTAKPRN